MSREQIVTAYLEGRISRRTLVRRLAAAGVSVGAAVAYARSLGPAALAATPFAVTDHYPFVTLKVPAQAASQLNTTQEVKVVAKCSEPVEIVLNLLKKQGGGLLQLSNRIEPIGTGKTVFLLQVAVTFVAGDVVVASAQATDTDNLRTFSSARQTLG
jgi:hypothetical protein